jgi:hypothetical protein
MDKKTPTVADFVEENADLIFTVEGNGKIVLSRENTYIIRQKLIALFQKPHTLRAEGVSEGLLVSGYSYQLLNKEAPRGTEHLMMIDAESSQGAGEYCISLKEFINAFSNGEIPAFS